LNEPGGGFIGAKDLSTHGLSLLGMGASPTPYQAMLLGAGHTQEVDILQMGFNGAESVGKQTLNPKGERLWREGYDCVWKQNGVWTDEGDSPLLLRSDYFSTKNGQPVNFAEDYLKPFIKRFATAIREVHPAALLFLEGVPGGAHPHWGADDPPQAVNAAHWYDVITLITKQFNPEFTIDFITKQPVTGQEAVIHAFTDQLGRLKQMGIEQMGGIPTIVGEFGIPFDLDEKRAYQTGDFSTHTQALDFYYDAMDANLLNCTIWNYTADNTNERGDLWNDEDLSIFSRDQQDSDDIHSGGRGLAAIVRPYARKIAGEPLRMSFELTTKTFELDFRHDPAITAPTEIFLPDYQYPQGYTVELSDGTYRIEGNLLLIEHTTQQDTHTVRVSPKSAL
jgi:hypothetical protein